MALSPDTYSKTDIVFTYSPFTVEPSFCEMTVSCKTVSGPSNLLGCKELTDGKLTWNFSPDDYTVDKLTPGQYTYTFDVSTGNDPALTKQFSFKLTLIDSCETPVITSPTTAPQEYTITGY